MDPQAASEEQLLSKVWWRILPFVFILFIINILDRVNIGYTALSMNADLGITTAVFGLISGIFFLGYFLFEIPSNQILARVGACLWLGRIMISWGIIVLVMAFVQTAFQLGTLRFLLGVAEAGFFPGIILYLSFWFTKDAIARSYAVFIAAMPIAMVIGSPVSTAIIQYVDWLGIAGWRWVFVIQGLLAVGAGISTLLFLPSTPKKARWLTSGEKERLEETLQCEKVRDGMPRHMPLRELARSRPVRVLTVCLFLVYLALFGIVFWLPQIVQSFYATISVFDIGVLLMVPYAAAALVMFLWGRHSDRTGERLWHVILPLIVAAGTFFADALVVNSEVSMVLLGIAIVALFSALPSFWAIVIDALAPGLRPAGTAFINSFASLGSFVGPVLFGVFVERSAVFDEVFGMVVLGGALVAGAVLLWGMGWEKR
jgi:ACS family tartrate transporter-like MFS transporter